jgi:2'-5' RNA ligase superfamily
MRTLYTVSYPEVSDADRERIEAFRRVHDLPYRDVIAAHFTMVFGVRNFDEDLYSKHVAAVANSSGPIEFTCRYAMLGADDADDTAYVFLVPDEGYSSVSLLHDRLYTGPLQQFHRLDIPYIPHITVGTMSDRAEAKELCNRLNQEGVSISGRLTTLTVGALSEGRFANLQQLRLAAV